MRLAGLIVSLFVGYVIGNVVAGLIAAALAVGHDRDGRYLRRLSGTTRARAAFPGLNPGKV